MNNTSSVLPLFWHGALYSWWLNKRWRFCNPIAELPVLATFDATNCTYSYNHPVKFGTVFLSPKEKKAPQCSSVSHNSHVPYAIILAYILHTVHSVLPQVTGKSLMTAIIMHLQQLEWNCNGCIDYNCSYTVQQIVALIWEILHNHTHSLWIPVGFPQSKVDFCF